jgi:hypothetical protein
MAWALDDILPEIVNAGDAGVPRGRIKEKVAKRHRDEISQTLKALVDAKEVWGPVKHGNSEYYFAWERGPSAKTAANVISGLVSKSGTRLLTKTQLEKQVGGMDAKFFAEGIELAISTKRIVQLVCGKSKRYFHRETAEKYFSLALPPPVGRPDRSELTMETVRPILLRLTAEQGGLSTIKIYDLLRSLDVSKEELHEFLKKEAKAGRLTIHPTTSVKLMPEVIEAGIKLPGFSEPFVTVAIRD